MKKAFSLSEVSLVLTIIGIIAAFLIPNFYGNIREHKMMTMLKKVYSAYNVNIQTLLGESNCSSISCLRIYGNGDDDDSPLDMSHNPITLGEHSGIFVDKRYFNVASKCMDCFKDGDVLPDDDQVYGDGKPTNFTAYILENTAVTAIKDFAGNCTTTGLVTDGTKPAGQQDIPVCGILVIDANGTKGPNIPGKDRFGFYITDEPVQGSYLVAVGHNADLYAKDNIKVKSNEHTISAVGGGSCVPGNAVEGYNCTAEVLAKGWKQSDDVVIANAGPSSYSSENANEKKPVNFGGPSSYSSENANAGNGGSGGGNQGGNDNQSGGHVSIIGDNIRDHQTQKDITSETNLNSNFLIIRYSDGSYDHIETQRDGSKIQTSYTSIPEASGYRATSRIHYDRNGTIIETENSSWDYAADGSFVMTVITEDAEKIVTTKMRNDSNGAPIQGGMTIDTQYK